MSQTANSKAKMPFVDGLINISYLTVLSLQCISLKSISRFSFLCRKSS